MERKHHEVVKLEERWYANPLFIPMPVTIVTTVNKKGEVNAAPYSLLSIYDALKENPRIAIQILDMWHTGSNIRETGEFVVNFPTFDLLDEVIRTSQRYEEGVNELDHTSFTQIPSEKVKPPRIDECYQHLECILDSTNKPFPEYPATNYIGKIVSASVDTNLLKEPGVDKIREANPIIYLGENPLYEKLLVGKLGQMEVKSVNNS